VAILEGLGPFKSLERGGLLAKGGQGRLALVFFLYLALVAAGVAGFLYAVMGFEICLGTHGISGRPRCWDSGAFS